MLVTYIKLRKPFIIQFNIFKIIIIRSGLNYKLFIILFKVKTISLKNIKV